MIVIDDYPSYQVNELGEVYSNKTGKIKKLKPYPSYLGYLQVRLFGINGGKTFSVHRLVAKAYLPNPENKLSVNHINGVRNDNRVENLEWCTQKENMRHAVNNQKWWGLTGENHPDAKLNWEKVAEIKKLLLTGKPKKHIAREYGVDQKTIYNINKNLIWQHKPNDLEARDD